jgi:hypothetical protein
MCIVQQQLLGQPTLLSIVREIEAAARHLPIHVRIKVWQERLEEAR